MPKLAVKHVDGFALGVSIRNHRIIVDAPKVMGGEDSGPTPVDLLAGSLGACVAMYIARWCRHAKVPYEGFEVEVDYAHEPGDHCVSAMTVNIRMPEGFPKERREALLKVATGCTVHNTLCNRPELKVAIAEG